MKFKEHLKAFESAIRAHENMSSQPPSQWSLIEEEYRQAKDNLVVKYKQKKLKGKLGNDTRFSRVIPEGYSNFSDQDAEHEQQREMGWLTDKPFPAEPNPYP